MAVAKKTYHLLSAFDMKPPPSGPLGLGSILSAPDDPYQPLNQLPLTVPIPPDAINTIVETAWQKTITSSTNVSGGVYASFLQNGILGAEISSKRETSSENVYAFDTMTTVSFQPDEQFVARLVRSSVPIQRYMDASWYRRRPVYIVVGYKAVKGARIKNTLSQTWGANMNLGVDLTSMGVPVHVGPQANIDGRDGDETERGSADEMLFAYRLREVKWKKGTVSMKSYDKGAFLGADEDDSDDEPGFEVDRVGKEDTMGDQGSGSHVLAVPDEVDGEVVNVVCAAS